MTLDVTFEPDNTSFTPQFAESFNASGGGTSDHAALTNRGAADQHPIEAISGLRQSLDGKQPTGSYLKDGDVPEWALDPQKPEYSAEDVGALPANTKIPSALSELSEDTSHRTVTDAEKQSWSNKSDFSGSYNDLTDKPTIPTVPVQSVNGKTGKVNLNAADVGALPNTTVIPTVPENVSEFNNDAGYLTGYTETDPTVPAWAKTPKKPTYSASEVGADPAGTASSQVSAHNTLETAHNDIRLLIAALTQQVTNFLNVSDTSRDQLSEILALIDDNADSLEKLTTGKVNTADIVNNLTTNVSTKPLSAAQGVVLKALIDAITVPTKLSQLTNDRGFITGYTETDPTVPDWAKAPNKPSYTKAEVGLGNVDNVKQYSASNPPPYPVTSVNGQTGAVALDAEDVGALPDDTKIPAKLSDLTADSTHRTVTDAEKLAWNGKSNFSGSYNDLTDKPTIPTVPVKSVNGKTGAVLLEASDVGAVPTASALTVTGVDADGTTHTWTMYGVKN